MRDTSLALEITSAAIGMVGDGVTDNSAAFVTFAAAANAGEQLAESTSGVFNFLTPPPPITSGKFTGSGRHSCADGNARGPMFGPHGTIFRHTGTNGNSITLGGEFEWSGFSLWPTEFKTGGAEICIQGDASDFLLDSFRINNGFQSILIGSEINGLIRRGRMQGCFGRTQIAGGITTYPAHVRCFGAGPAQSQLVNGVTFEDVIAYTPWPVAQPEAGQVGAWVADTSVSPGVIYFLPNGAVVQYRTAGVTGASPPGLPPFVLSADPYLMLMTDGTATCQFVCDANLIGWLADSWSTVMDLSRVQMLAMVVGFGMFDTASGGACPPSRITAYSCKADHNIGAGFKLMAGSTAAFDKCLSTNSATAQGLLVGGIFAPDLYWGPGDRTGNAGGEYGGPTGPGYAVHPDWQ